MGKVREVGGRCSPLCMSVGLKYSGATATHNSGKPCWAPRRVTPPIAARVANLTRRATRGLRVASHNHAAGNLMHGARNIAEEQIVLIELVRGERVGHGGECAVGRRVCGAASWRGDGRQDPRRRGTRLGRKRGVQPANVLLRQIPAGRSHASDAASPVTRPRDRALAQPVELSAFSSSRIESPRPQPPGSGPPPQPMAKCDSARAGVLPRRGATSSHFDRRLAQTCGSSCLFPGALCR